MRQPRNSASLLIYILHDKLLIIPSIDNPLCLAGQDIAPTNNNKIRNPSINFLQHMATQSIIRNGMTSPVRVMFKTTGSTRSILKRPAGLPLSPVYASFSVQAQVSPHLKSPHVQFLPSPSLVSTFAAHSAASYDRAPISASPLERTYMTLEGFKLSAPPKPFRSISKAQSSPAITDFEDPRSPKAQPADKQAPLRFASFDSNQTVTRPSKPLAKSLASYPRSPYPSAPLTPDGQAQTSGQWPKDRKIDDNLSRRTRSSSLDLPKRNKKGLTLAPSTVIPVAPTPSSLGRSVFSPAVSSINRGKKPAPLDLESRLSQDFWQSLSLEEAEKTDDEVMVTALEWPVSAVEYEGKMDRDTHIQVMYGGADGALWSPGMPKPGAALGRIRDSLMSPGQKSSFSSIVRKDFTAPSPNDPFAAFPSFAAAIEMGSITYSPRVALECGI